MATSDVTDEEYATALANLLAKGWVEDDDEGSCITDKGLEIAEQKWEKLPVEDRMLFALLILARELEDEDLLGK